MNETLEAYSTKGQSSDGVAFFAAGSALQQSSDRLAQAELSRNTVSGEIKPYDERWAPDLYEFCLLISKSLDVRPHANMTVLKSTLGHNLKQQKENCF